MVTLVQGQTAQAKADQVKAAFLYNFTQFVDWPQASFNNEPNLFVIGILGSDPFGAYLEELVSGEKVGGRNIAIRRFASASDVKGCHLLFVNVPDVGEVVKTVRNQSILTVSSHSDFASAGGMIQFFLENNKIRFKINPSAARRAGLNISSKLLRLAQIVE